MYYFMRTLSTNTTNLAVEPIDTNENVKVMIQDQDGISHNQRKLMFAGNSWMTSTKHPVLVEDLEGVHQHLVLYFRCGMQLKMSRQTSKTRKGFF